LALRRLGALHAATDDLHPEMARGLAFAFLVKALARHAVTAREGVGDAAGKPARRSGRQCTRLPAHQTRRMTGRGVKVSSTRSARRPGAISPRSEQAQGGGWPGCPRGDGGGHHRL
jgi:hypothetical protein